jgi:hypothetical protein
MMATWTTARICTSSEIADSNADGKPISASDGLPYWERHEIGNLDRLPKVESPDPAREHKQYDLNLLTGETGPFRTPHRRAAESAATPIAF